MIRTDCVRLRLLIASFVVASGYFFIFHADLMRWLGKYYFWYSVGLIASISIAALGFQERRLRSNLGWATATTLAASFIGYVMLTLQYYVEHGHFVRATFLEWLFVSTLVAYVRAHVWAISLGLLTACVIDDYIDRPCVIRS